MAGRHNSTVLAEHKQYTDADLAHHAACRHPKALCREQREVGMCVPEAHLLAVLIWQAVGGFRLNGCLIDLPHLQPQARGGGLLVHSVAHTPVVAVHMHTATGQPSSQEVAACCFNPETL